MPDLCRKHRPKVTLGDENGVYLLAYDPGRMRAYPVGSLGCCDSTGPSPSCSGASGAGGSRTEDKKVRAVKTGAGWIYDPDDLEMFKARMKASKGG